MADCENIKPRICGKNGIYTPSDECRSVIFTGVEDVTISKGDSFDPSYGVHAYDGNGNEISFTYTPTEIDTSKVGTYNITYTATGAKRDMKPTFCGSDVEKVHMLDCGTETARVTRQVIVEGAEPIYIVLEPIEIPGLQVTAVGVQMEQEAWMEIAIRIDDGSYVAYASGTFVDIDGRTHTLVNEQLVRGGSCLNDGLEAVGDRDIHIGSGGDDYVIVNDGEDCEPEGSGRIEITIYENEG